MACKILKDKNTNEDFLVPDCYGVVNHYQDDLPIRKIIKDFCYCNRSRKNGNDKYEQHTKDEVVEMISELNKKLEIKMQELESLKEELDILKSEVFCLNTVEVFQ